MNYIFYDGFEWGIDENDFPAWSSKSGNPIRQGSILHHGSYATQIPIGDKLYRIFEDKDSINVRVYVRWTSTPTSGNEARLFNIGHTDGTGTLVTARIVNDSGTMKWGLRTLNSGETYVSDEFTTGPTPTSDTWFCVELTWEKNTSNGASIYVDGELVGTTTATTANRQADSLNLWLEMFEINGYYDCATIAEGYIGVDIEDFTVNGQLFMPCQDAVQLDKLAFTDAIYGWTMTYVDGIANQGNYTFNVENGALFHSGDHIVIYDDDFVDVPAERHYIESVDGNQITLKGPPPAGNPLQHTYTEAANATINKWTPNGFNLPENLMHLGDNVDGHNTSVFLVRITGGSDPIFTIDQGMVVKKDLTAGGFLGTNQGEVWIGHGRDYMTDPPTIVLSHGGSAIKQGGTATGTWAPLESNYGFFVGDVVTIKDEVNSETKYVESISDDPVGITLKTALANNYTTGYVSNYDTLHIERVDCTPGNVKLGTMIANQLDIPSQHDVFSVIALDNGEDTDVYLVPQNPSNDTGLGLGAVASPFKWVDATNVFADNINGLKADEDLTITPNAGQKVVVDGDIDVTGSISTDDQLKIGYDGSWTQIQFENDSDDSMIAKSVKASSPNWLWLEAYADNGYNATVGMFRHTVSGTPRFLILNGDDYVSTPFEFLPRDGKMTIFSDTNLYRSAANTLKTDDDFICSKLTSDELEVKSPNNVFGVVAGDNGVGQDTYLVPQNPGNGAGLGLGTAVYPFKWVDATNVFANNINGLDDVDMNINPTGGRKVVINGDLQVTGAFSTGTQKGSNTTDANGDRTVNFAQAFGSAPLVFVQSRDSSGRGVRFDVTSKSTTSFTVKATVLPTTHKHQIGQANATVAWTMGVDNATGAHKHGFDGVAAVDLAHTHGTHQHGFGSGAEQAAVDLAHSHGTHQHGFGAGAEQAAVDLAHSHGTHQHGFGAGDEAAAVDLTHSHGSHTHSFSGYGGTTSNGSHAHASAGSHSHGMSGTGVQTGSTYDHTHLYYVVSGWVTNSGGSHSHAATGNHTHTCSASGTTGSSSVSLGSTISYVGGNTAFTTISLGQTLSTVGGNTAYTTVSLGTSISTVGGNTAFTGITLGETLAYVGGYTKEDAAHGHDLSNKAPLVRNILLRDENGAEVVAGGTMTTVGDTIKQLYTEAADLSAESKVVDFDWMAIVA